MSSGVCTSWACDAMGLGMSVLQLGQFIPQHMEMVRFLWLAWSWCPMGSLGDGERRLWPGPVTHVGTGV